MKKRLYAALAFLLLFTFPEQGQILKIQVGAFHLFLFRLLLPLTFGILLLNGDVKLTGRFGKWFTLILVAWISYAVISLSWVQSLDWAYYDLAYLGIALLTFLTLSSLFVALDREPAAFVRGWLAAFVVLVPVAIWEVTTGNHLEGQWLEHSITDFIDHPNRLQPATVFGNPNDYASFMVMTIPVAVVTFYRGARWISWLFVWITVVLSYQASSRLALVAVAVQLIILVVLSAVRSRYAERLRVGVPALATIIVSIGAYMMIQRTGGASDSKQPVAKRSTAVRWNLVRSGWTFFKESKGIGIGAGNFEVYLEESDPPYPKPSVRNPHNWYIEILSEYGVLIFSVFAALVLGLGVTVSRSTLSVQDPEVFRMALYGLLTIASYLVICCLSSTFMNKLFNWIPFTFLIIGCDQLRAKPRTA